MKRWLGILSRRETIQRNDPKPAAKKAFKKKKKLKLSERVCLRCETDQQNLSIKEEPIRIICGINGRTHSPQMYARLVSSRRIEYVFKNFK